MPLDNNSTLDDYDATLGDDAKLGDNGTLGDNDTLDDDYTTICNDATLGVSRRCHAWCESSPSRN